MMYQSRLLPVSALFVAAGIFFAYINPTWTGSIAATQVAIAADNQTLAAANHYAEQQNQLASERNAIAPSNLAQLEEFLPNSVDNVSIILDLNALAARSGLTLSGANVANTGAQSSTGAPTTSSNPVGSVNLLLNATGTYGALQNFLNGVEHSRRLLDVQDLAITGSDTGVYTYTMTLRLYWLR